MGEWYRNRTLRVILALVVVVTGVTLVVTTGDSWAVRWIALLVSLEVAARLAIPR